MAPTATMVVQFTSRGLLKWTPENIPDWLKEMYELVKDVKPWKLCAQCKQPAHYYCAGCRSSCSRDKTRYCVRDIGTEGRGSSAGCDSVGGVAKTARVSAPPFTLRAPGHSCILAPLRRYTRRPSFFSLPVTFVPLIYFNYAVTCERKPRCCFRNVRQIQQAAQLQIPCLN